MMAITCNFMISYAYLDVYLDVITLKKCMALRPELTNSKSISLQRKVNCPSIARKKLIVLVLASCDAQS